MRRALPRIAPTAHQPELEDRAAVAIDIGRPRPPGRHGLPALVLAALFSLGTAACGGGSDATPAEAAAVGDIGPVPVASGGGAIGTTEPGDVSAGGQTGSATTVPTSSGPASTPAPSSPGTGAGPSPSPSPSPTPSPSPAPAPGTGQALRALGSMQSGDGTYHPGSDGHGSCEFGPSPNDLMIAAINRDLNGGPTICGAFARVTGPKGSVVVRIVDSCPECKQGDLDFSVEAFAKIATAPPGRVPIRWQLVAGDVQGPIRLRYREGASRSWVAIQVRNHRLPIASLDVMPSGETSWRSVPRQSWNYFVVNGKVAAGPIRVRVTATDGQTLEELMPEPQGALEVVGRGQFQ